MSNIKVLILCVIIPWGFPAIAAVESASGPVKRTLTDSQYFGLCMVELDYVASINCNNSWISLDCSGSYHDKETSRRLWDSVQLAKALDTTVQLVVNDANKHNGFCVADRVYVK